MALIDKIIGETWVRARPRGVLFSVHSDIWFLGAVSYIKRNEWCGCIVWTILPGLVGAIVLNLRHTAVAMKQFQPPCTHRSPHKLSGS